MSLTAPLLLAWTILAAPQPTPPPAAEEGWISLFNGTTLEGWTPKIAGHPLGEDPYDTVRVEDGMIRIGYENYEGEFNGRFLHLFHDQPFSRYRLRVEYRFHSGQMIGAPGWAFRNSGAMLHCQNPASMGVAQEFPVSIEGQFLGGIGAGDRTTGNLCTPGTHVVLDGRFDARHCINSSSETMHGDRWVTAEFEVDGHRSVKHFINGTLVMEYEQPQYDETDPDARAIEARGLLDRGWIALQGESHPVDFRKVQVRPLEGPDVVGGPVLGDLRSSGAAAWIRLDEPGPVSMTLVDVETGDTSQLQAQATPGSDGSVRVSLEGLEPATNYRLKFHDFHGTTMDFTTLPVDGDKARIAFGSCAKEAPGSATVWKRMDAEDISALVLLGDTPYIDTTDLETQRRRYREFAAADGFKQLAARVPVYSTWDDHDIGRNDTDGNLEGKENSRQAFMEHRPNPSYGRGEDGIYTKFRQGPVEVFILDTRWFARTEGTEEDPTLLGAAQWSWLDRSLRSSTAPFKVIACGMVFNNAVRPGKTDCWGRYPLEYERLLALLEDLHLQDVILVAGDVHWSRCISHGAEERLGFELMEFITSPVHEHLIKAADAPHPGLRWSRGEINSFLLLDASRNDEGTLVLDASFRNAAGDILHEERFESDE